MSATVRVVCSQAVAGGFALASLPHVLAETGEEAAAKLADLRDSPEVGVVLIEEPLYDSMPEEILRSLSASAVPMVVPFPGPVWKERPPAEEYIVELLRRAIGYRVRLR
ncbi:MAG: V-type ATP synthase subunit F [Gemmatimonadota bacterium]|nr:V-type ATP synthase subunit F [Gemmatimonadota bacterium]